MAQTRTAIQHLQEGGRECTHRGYDRGLHQSIAKLQSYLSTNRASAK